MKESGVTAKTSIQDNYLNQLRKEKIPVLIYLTNGVKLKGFIQGFDNFVVVLRESVPQIVYKHAISTILPQRDVNLKGLPADAGGYSGDGGG